MMHAASKLELPATGIRERDGGLASVRFINKLAASLNSGNTGVVDEILTEMAAMARTVLNKDRIGAVMVNTSPDHRNQFVRQTESFLKNLPASEGRLYF